VCFLVAEHTDPVDSSDTNLCSGNYLVVFLKKHKINYIYLILKFLIFRFILKSRTSVFNVTVHTVSNRCKNYLMAYA